MNTFLAIMCLAVVATAAPQSGYNYQQANKQIFRPSQPASNSGIYAVQQSAPLNSFNVQQQLPQQQQQQFQSHFVSSGLAPQFNGQSAVAQFDTPVQAPQYLAPVQQQNIYSGPAPVATFTQNTHSNYQHQPQQQQQQVIVSKDIYIHAAPEETEVIGNDRAVEAGPLRKNYRIVFIKAPTQNVKLNLASLKRAQVSNEEKTVIYVLSKKPDLAAIQTQLSAVQTEQKAHKPEVYFIKYKTQEEANRAQEEIQAQYDSLGGSTSISNEGIAPITSVIGGGRVNVGSVGTSLSGTNGGSFGGTSFTGGNVGTFNGGSNIVQTAGPVQNQHQHQQQFVQQSYQSNHGSSSSAVNFGGVPSQIYGPSKKN